LKASSIVELREQFNCSPGQRGNQGERAGKVTNNTLISEGRGGKPMRKRAVRLGCLKVAGSVVLMATLWSAAEASRLAFEVDSDNVRREFLLSLHHPYTQPCCPVERHSEGRIVHNFNAAQFL
jgi:hypothetical protein